MCGIMGYAGTRPAVDVLIQGLKRLEYRGYDSAGVAVMREGHIEVKKSQGKLANVEKLLNGSAPLFRQSEVGIGHTRWATHGKPTTQNAHPHQTGHVVLVHNGIIENYLDLKEELLTRGHHPRSETDSELFGFLVLDAMDSGADLVTAVRQSFARLQGQCSILAMSEREPEIVVAVRNGSPLVAALDPQGGASFASDAQPLLAISQDVYFLEHGDIAVASKKGLEFLSLETGKPIARQSTHLDWSAEKMDLQGYPHYMLKEIYEQPTALLDTLNLLVDRTGAEPFQLAETKGAEILDGARKLVLVACGTSWHAALLAQYWIENWAQIPVQVELASEFRYRDPVLETGTVVAGISQSGETADTLAVLREVKARGIPTLGLTNVRGSTISREVDAVFYTAAGPEIGVAATKTLSAQMFALLIWAGYLAMRRRTRTRQEVDARFAELIRLPHHLTDLLNATAGVVANIDQVAEELFHRKLRGFFFIGRGWSYPIALEGALKLKEIAYVHAEGYAAGELKHGPIAMIDEDMAVVVLAPHDLWREKTISNLEEVKARGAQIIAIGDQKDERLKSLARFWIGLPSEGVPASLQSFLILPAVQLLSYRLALLHGTDVDRPRNLAKSVTVE